jgi:hypothetical protein
MELTDFYLERHAVLHGRMTETELLGGMADYELRARPHGVNSIVWLLWHVARCEDGAVNFFVAEQPQLIDREPWMERMNVPLRHKGTAMTSDEVDELSARVDVAALRAYWDAVGANTRSVVSALAPGRLDEIVDPEDRRRVLVDEGFAGPHEKVAPDPRPRAWFLAYAGMTHGHGHFFEGFVTRGLVVSRRGAEPVQAT